MMKLFADRRHAGRVLAAELTDYTGIPGVLVLALPRGGVPVAFEVATALGTPLDVLIVRKLGAPWNAEFAVGAIASGGLSYIDEQTMRDLNLTPGDLQDVIAREQIELARRERQYRGNRPFPDLAGRTVIVVDDGLATGATMQAAIRAIRKRHPARLIAAAPVGSRSACEALAAVADRVVCAAEPEPFYGVGLWYGDFSETSDAEVAALLQGANERLTPSAA